MNEKRREVIRENRSRNLYIRLAWRNIWRNKRRSLLLIASVVIAVFIAVAYTSTQIGQDEYMIYASVGLFDGHIQVHGKNYWNTRSLDESMELSQQEIDSMQAVPHVEHIAPRLETVSLISHQEITKISPIIGIDPTLENEMTGLRARLIKGNYLTADSHGIMLAEGLARLLHVSTGDSVVIYGQGYHEMTAAAIVPVQGIVKYPIPDLNNTMAYISLHYARQLYSAPNRLTSLAFLLVNDKYINDVTSSLKKIAGPSKEVMTWKQLMPEIEQGINVNDAGTVLTLLILYVVIGFGIFGTVMMMTVERTREFGILISIGMKRWRLASVTFIESVVLSVIGSIIGIIIAIPPVYYFYYHPIHVTGSYAQAMLAYGFEPIIPLSIAPMVFLWQGLIIFFVGIVSSLYPLLVIRSLNPGRAIRE
jgi:ABC-type lipoprotein release transport system permease subunit